MLNFWISFSDSAKYAEAAKNIVLGQGLVIHHSLFNISLLVAYTPGSAFSPGFHPLTSWVLSLIFRVFPATDTTVALTGLSLWILTSILVYFIARKLHSSQAGFISALFLMGNTFFLDYAKNATTEIFLSLEMVLAMFLYINLTKKKWLSLIPIAAMFFTRPQSIIFLGAVLLMALVFSRKRILILAGTVCVILIGIPLSYKYPFVSPAYYINSIFITSKENSGSYMRGSASDNISVRDLAVKSFYNLYNFLKAPERLANPVILALFAYGLFTLFKKNNLKLFYFFTALTSLLFIMAASVTLPNARYFHPVLPLLFIGAGIGLIEISKNIRMKYIFMGLILFMISLPMLGYLTVDARFRRQQFNVNEPPAHKVISDVMAQNIPQKKMIITNLDAWAAWYYGLTTMWFPLTPNMLIPPPGRPNKADYIVITNYLANDANFALGDWKEVVDSPDKISNQFLATNYHILKTFVIPASANYDNQEYRGTILVRNN